ncbi:MotE family protein [Kordiimonas pumila]|uniref:MotE family protein n=1 Tax=Kordiimonas pumila TaxID=2161677 RepID=A0ABV7D3N1_9PROT|nr:hypothetical protein [Kordiimonas pumila]
MRNTIISRIRLFPMLIMVALVSLSLRAVDIYTGLNFLEIPVIAEENAAEAATKAEEKTETAHADVGGEAARAPIIVGLPDNEEMEIITQLRQRRVELEQRSNQLELQEQLLSSTEKRIDDKIVQLQALEQQIKGHLRLYEERENEQLQSIVKVYETMKPKEAAPRFEVLSLQTQLDLVTRMKPNKVAALMEKMSPNRASALTTELATRAQPPGISELQGDN